MFGHRWHLLSLAMWWLDIESCNPGVLMQRMSLIDDNYFS